MKVPEQLGARLFQSRKSPIRFGCWTALVLIPALVLVFPVKQVTMNEIIGSVVLGIVTLYLLLDFLWARVIVYENGLIHKRLFARTNIIVFNEFTQVFVRRWCLGFLSARFLPHVTIFIDNDGFHYKISSNFNRNNEIIKVMEAYIYKNSMYMLNQLFDADEVLAFGDVQLSRNHVVVGGKYLLRNQIGQLSIKDGYVRLYEKSEKGGVKRLTFSKTKLRNVANFNMLCRFIEFNDVNVEQFGYRVYKIPFL
ncbi:DUF6585 family protein [Alysiella crassa]|uniref:Uncharacterized protein n=1 Tax=Alysiella crassa TaxID=153491 RepID=A0A376BJS4_9NEIS|nr:DUF6585 family protein [Alysiella crassa]UOP07755.1 hypothetical protein LVJ80_05240 [Alysiella crassa]SSY70002.1 Uncharacterised protein [Alysiella crassa]